MPEGIESPLSDKANMKLDENDRHWNACTAAIAIASAAVIIFLLNRVPTSAELLRTAGILSVIIFSFVLYRKMCARFRKRAELIVGEDPD